ncbi:hypothetical protein [Sphingomonas colocasiae]|uniref:Peptidase n=1 Tax=Sphingomonas colocasiae TaxID=1848973 RepID=A0ABS7PKQ5_9SPHN|nr:hypothetical protein [Sphingomonas colocasiae]MBY8821818.1 hypothetical protein [Sphingomonas colocasiae]
MTRVSRVKAKWLATALTTATLTIGAAAPAQKAGGAERQIQGALTSASPKNDGHPYQVRTMPLEAGKRYALGAESEAFDPTLRISFADDDDEALAEDDDGGDGSASYIEFTPERSGTYRLRVASAGRDTGAYLLKMRDLPPLPAPLRPSPVGSSSIAFKHYAGALTGTDGEIRGRRVDDYQFRFEGGKQVFLFMDRDNDDIDPMIEVHAGTGRTNAEPIAGDDDGGDGVNALLIFTPEESGDFIVRATTSNTDATGSYKLRVGQEP